MDYVIHFLLELVGQGVLYVAYKHICRHAWHRAVIWFIGTALASIVTVHLVG
jgi:hypothetical protein